MPIVVEVVSPKNTRPWWAEQRKKSAAARTIRNKKWNLADLKAAWREVYRGELRRLPPAGGQGVEGRLPALDGRR